MYYEHQERHSSTISWNFSDLYGDAAIKAICNKLNIDLNSEDYTPNEERLVTSLCQFQRSCRKNPVLKTLHLRAGEKTVTIVFSMWGDDHGG